MYTKVEVDRNAVPRTLPKELGDDQQRMEWCGSLWEDTLMHNIYMLTIVDRDAFILVSINNGNRYYETTSWEQLANWMGHDFVSFHGSVIITSK